MKEKKSVFYEILATAVSLGMIFGGYHLVKFVHKHNKDKVEIDSLFYSGCKTSQDSTQRVYDAGLGEYL